MTDTISPNLARKTCDYCGSSMPFKSPMDGHKPNPFAGWWRVEPCRTDWDEKMKILDFCCANCVRAYMVDK